MGHTSTRLPEMIQVFKCANITSGSKTVLIHASTESRTEFSTRLSQLESVLVSRASGAFHLKLFLKETIPLESVNLPPKEKQTHPQATRSRWFITFIVPTSGSL